MQNIVVSINLKKILESEKATFENLNRNKNRDPINTSHRLIHWVKRQSLYILWDVNIYYDRDIDLMPPPLKIFFSFLLLLLCVKQCVLYRYLTQ